jgi:hypothetical protein
LCQITETWSRSGWWQAIQFSIAPYCIFGKAAAGAAHSSGRWLVGDCLSFWRVLRRPVF